MVNPRKVNVDLENERKKCNFDISEFTTWWYGGEQKLKYKRKFEKLILDDPSLQSATPQYFLSHKERYEDTIRTLCLIAEKVRKLRSEGDEDFDLEKVFFPSVPGFAPSGNTFSLHFGLFMNMVNGQGTDEQRAFWLPKAKNLEIIGCYAQTELGHGTYVRGLETVATYDPSTKEFVLNSPSLSAFKFWPGALGQTASHAVLMAQLVTQGKARGVYPFIVPLRDLDTYKPLPGVTIGEIGPKSIDAMNNGFLGLSNVRIPRDHMLMRTAQVLEDGTFVQGAPSILTYQTMTSLRVDLIGDIAEALLKAATIAIRYSAVRRQSQINADAAEVQIMDHLTQQLKLFPQLAKGIVLKLAADSVASIHLQVTEELLNGRFDRLQEIHALSCCLKAVSVSDAGHGTEVCRLACGGHGYLLSSGLPAISGYVATARAFEGENTVMLLQTARFLVKSWRNAAEGKALTPTVAYLSKVQEFKGADSLVAFDSSVEGIAEAFQWCTGQVVRLACEEIERKVKNQGQTRAEAVNGKSIELLRAAEMHCRGFLLRSAVQQLPRHLSTATTNVLRQLIQLHAIDSAINNLDLLLRFTKISAEQVAELEECLEGLLRGIRPNAVGVVDGFEFSDGVLRSALGAWDGNVYERLFEEAMKSPLNQEPVNRSFGLHLKPLLGAKM